nr:MAG TPA: hypothetical protein [Caudoviricetes sp.]
MVFNLSLSLFRKRRIFYISSIRIRYRYTRYNNSCLSRSC